MSFAPQGKLAEAEPLYAKAIAIWEKTGHRGLPSALNNLAGLKKAQARAKELPNHAINHTLNHALNHPPVSLSQDTKHMHLLSCAG